MKNKVLVGVLVMLLCGITGCQGKEEAERSSETKTVVPTLETTATLEPIATSTPMPTVTVKPIPTVTPPPIPSPTPLGTPKPTATNIPTPTPESTMMFSYVENGDGTVIVDGLSFEGRKALDKGKTEILIIPEDINGMKVVEVEEWAFEWEEGFKEVIFMGEDVKIGDGAFSGCMDLVKVVLPKKLQCVSTQMFSSCEKLQEIELPDSIQEIGTSAFQECSSLTSIELPPMIKKIGEYAFAGTSIAEITLPAGNLNIHIIYFDNEGRGYFCAEQGEADFSDSVFWGMTKLENIYVAEGNELYTSLDGVLYTKDLTELIKIPQNYAKPVVVPDTVTDVEMLAYDGCSKLEKISFPKGIEYINYFRWMKESCSNLKEIEIAEDNPKYRSIGTGVVKKGTYGDDLIMVAPGITEFTVPENVRIDYSADFTWCHNLKTIVVNENNKTYRVENGILYSSDMTELLVCPQKSGLTSCVVPETVTEIREGAFYGCEDLEYLDLSKTSITDLYGASGIDGGTFENCTKLKEIVFPETVTFLQKWDFIGCKNLIIKARKGSYVEKFAKENGIPFEER